MKHPCRLQFEAVCLMALAALTSCGSTPRVRVTSQPETARVYVNGTLAGNTPTDVTLPFSEGPRVYLQVVHPDARRLGEQILTADNLPSTGEISFDLRN